MLLKRHSLNFFLRNVVQSLCNNIAQDQDCISVNIEWNVFFMQSCLEPLRKHCIGFKLAVQCCPKSIKTTLHGIFSYVKMSGASRTTLHMVFTCAMLSQEYSGKIAQGFSCNVIWSLPDNIASGFDLCSVIQEY